MEKTPEQDVRTADLHLAAFIKTVTDITPSLVGDPTRNNVMFVYPSRPEVEAAIVSFSTGAMVPAQTFSNEVRQLKRQLYIGRAGGGR